MERAAAVLIKAKIAMLEIWQLGLSWDEDVPSETRKKWIKLFEGIEVLNDVKFDRCLTPAHAARDPMLVAFCNASRCTGLRTNSPYSILDVGELALGS